MDVVLEHIDTMAKYHAYVVPIENLRKVFDNTSVTNGDYDSTKALIESLFGKSAKDYFDRYITDLNGGNSSIDQNPLSKLFGRAKGMAVAGKLSVAVQQPTAIIRAMDEIDIKYFILNSDAKKKASDYKRQWDEMKKHAPIAVVKEMGGFDMGSNRTTKDYIGKDYKQKDLSYWGEKASDATMWLAGKGDEVGWSIIWKAVKAEVADKQGLKPGTEEFYKACEKRAAEVMVKTQVYDSVNNRSQAMRSKNDSVKYLTSFMGEPTKTANMAFSAAVELTRAIKSKDKAKIKSASKKLGKRTSILAASGLAAAIFRTFIYAMDDDDDEKSLLERWSYHLGDAVKGDLNPFTYLPFTRDIVSLMEGYKVERPDMSLIAAVIKAYENTTKETATYKDTLKLFGAIGNLCGIPAQNVAKDAVGIFRLFFIDPFDDKEADDILMYFGEGFSGDRTPKERAEAAYERGDMDSFKKTVSKIIEDKVKAGKTEKEAKSAVRSSFTSSYKPEYMAAVKAKDYDEMNRIRKFLYATGLYGTLSELDETLKKWRTSE